MQTITTDAVKQLQDAEKQVPIINVLPPKYFRNEHIPGSINIPIEDDGFVENVSKTVADKHEPVVVYCANTECDASPKAGKQLEQAGFEQVFDYEGGMDAWKKAGHEVDRN